MADGQLYSSYCHCDAYLRFILNIIFPFLFDSSNEKVMGIIRGEKGFFIVQKFLESNKTISDLLYLTFQIAQRLCQHVENYAREEFLLQILN